ncbi:hypothetical protein SAMN06272735_9173 [Streptomyces sp. TLI_55]|uniref:hypothetical protein n=1 Tax=Streptomyces sp. TLI_55 TaxID=1938861 RepID=UPI000BDD1070|nr:hypothetical protein [Streptomyces sp. TLI_55]SNX88682.1 hypothetical protein SAMN06272735_9173 [Streptomyces sp. TLI_55]
MSGRGAGLRRGVMAADQFTQIANGLLRDPQLSFRAKGLFGYLSTHRAGWEITLSDLVQAGPDGRDAVRAGLRELQEGGYLVRTQLRRADGTLAEIAYSLTDVPAAGATSPPQSGAVASVPASAAGLLAGAGIRRGAMAADQFTQIANRLFRDARLTWKAKGLFGLISTHRDGWRITVADLARHSRDGEGAVKSGLKELEHHGFVLRERTRQDDGTLRGGVYVITDQPDARPCRSHPEPGFPLVDEPTSADRPTKNTIVQKTNKQNTSPLPPCPHPGAHAPRGMRHPDGNPLAPPADELHPGIRLLLDIATSCPEFLLTGKALTDQGRVVTVMLERGWSPELLRHAITSRPLPHPVRTSVAAIVAARLQAAQAYPPPHTVTSHHTPGEAGQEPQGVARACTPSAARTVTEALTYRALVECTGCGRPGTADGEDLCPTCLGWPPCATCPGPTPRRAHPDSDGRCTTCASATTPQLEGASW